jgi:hypothetical protein
VDKEPWQISSDRPVEKQQRQTQRMPRNNNHTNRQQRREAARRAAQSAVALPPRRPTATEAALDLLPESHQHWSLGKLIAAIVVEAAALILIISMAQNALFAIGFQVLGVIVSAIGIQLGFLLLWWDFRNYRPSWKKEANWFLGICTLFLLLASFGIILMISKFTPAPAPFSARNQVALTVGKCVDDSDPFSTTFTLRNIGSDQILTNVHWSVQWTEPSGIARKQPVGLTSKAKFDQLVREVPQNFFPVSPNQISDLANDTTMNVYIMFSRIGEATVFTNQFKFKLWNGRGSYTWVEDGPGETEDQVYARLGYPWNDANLKSNVDNAWQFFPFIAIQDLQIEQRDSKLYKGYNFLMSYQLKNRGGVTAREIEDRWMIVDEHSHNTAIFQGDKDSRGIVEFLVPKSVYYATNTFGDGHEAAFAEYRGAAVPDTGWFPTYAEMVDGIVYWRVVLTFKDQLGVTYTEAAEVRAAFGVFNVRYFRFTITTPPGRTLADWAKKMIPDSGLPTNR